MEAQPERYHFDTVEVQPAAFAVLRDGRPVDLEPKAVRVLLYLIERRDRAVSKEELMEAVWAGTAVSDNALTRIVAQLRRELGDDARQSRYIQTLPTTGYRFIADLKMAPAQEPPPSLPPAPRSRRIILPVAAMAILVLAVSGWLVLRRGGVNPPDTLRSMQLTTSPGLDIGASFSPDGKSFVFSSNRSGGFEIYAWQVSGAGHGATLTNDGKQNIDPAWSPDGKWIAYHSVAQHGIWVIPTTGGSPRQLAQFGSSPAWSPDGRQIAFRAAEPLSFAWFDTGGTGASSIWTVAMDGSQLRQVTKPYTPRGQHGSPSWRPDGKALGFIALSPESEIWSLEVDSGKLELLTKVGRDIPRQPGTWFTRLWDLKFSPTGKGFYFSAMRGPGEYAIYFQQGPGARPVERYSTRSDVPSGLAVSPDGKQLLFTRFTNISQLWTVTPPSVPKPLFQESVLRTYLPGFSPDGKQLTFMVETAGRNRDLWIMNTGGSGAGPVSKDPGPKEAGVSWNLQGTGLLYNYVDGSRIEFRRYDPMRKTSQVLYDWPSSAGLFHPVLMPDEKEVLSACSTPMNICLSPAMGGPPRQITFEREGAAYPNISRDGQWITFELRRGETSQIALINRAGGHLQLVTDDPGLNWPFSFSSDNRRIAYASYRDGVWNIWWIDRFTRERRQLTHYTTYGSFVRSPAWRPATEEIVYEHSQVKGNVYLLDIP